MFHPDLAVEFQAFSPEVQTELAAYLAYLEVAGPALRRPHADTLNGSKHSNMKELRFNADGGVWRVAFAFDPVRQAVVLVAGDKSGVQHGRFYKALIRKADDRFDEHLEGLEKNDG